MIWNLKMCGIFQQANFIVSAVILLLASAVSCNPFMQVVLPPLSEACNAVPNCNIVSNHNILFPVSQDPTSYWQCAGTGTGIRPVMMDCQCMTYFMFRSQRCEWPSMVPANQLCPKSQNVKPRPCL